MIWLSSRSDSLSSQASTDLHSFPSPSNQSYLQSSIQAPTSPLPIRLLPTQPVLFCPKSSVSLSHSIHLFPHPPVQSPATIQATLCPRIYPPPTYPPSQPRPPSQVKHSLTHQSSLGSLPLTHQVTPLTSDPSLPSSLSSPPPHSAAHQLTFGTFVPQTPTPFSTLSSISSIPTSLGPPSLSPPTSFPSASSYSSIPSFSLPDPPPVQLLPAYSRSASSYPPTHPPSTPPLLVNKSVPPYRYQVASSTQNWD
jgi:hypothetical protein